MTHSTSIPSLLCSAAAVAALISPRSAVAEADASVGYELDYRAPEGCPAEAAFTDLIARRTARAHRSSGAGAKYRFTVAISLDDAGARGSLRITERDGVATDRDVPARDCANAVEAMALIAAVILDPRSATAPAAGGTPSESAPSPGNATPTTGERAPHEPQKKPAPTGARARSAEHAPPEAPARSEPWRTRLRVAGMLAGAVAPGAALGAAAGGEVYLPRRSAFEPRAALTANFAAAETSTRFGTAAFRWYAGRLAVCPLRWPDSGWLVLRSCAFAEVGALHGQGSHTQNARSSTAFWLAAGPAIELELALTSWSALAVEAGLTFPAFHDSFIFVPEEVAHEVPLVGGWLAAGFRLGPL